MCVEILNTTAYHIYNIVTLQQYMNFSCFHTSSIAFQIDLAHAIAYKSYSLIPRILCCQLTTNV